MVEKQQRLTPQHSLQKYADENAPFLALHGIDVARYRSFKRDSFSPLLNFRIPAGEFVGIYGSSQSQQLLCELLTGKVQPKHGYLKVNGVDLSLLSRREMGHWFCTRTSMIPAVPDLYSFLSLRLNMAYPSVFCRHWPWRVAKQRAESLLASVGLADKANKIPSQLSRAEMYRAVYARALMNNPQLIIAYEPERMGCPETAVFARQFLTDMVVKQQKTVLYMAAQDSAKDQFSMVVYLGNTHVTRLEFV